MTTENTNSPTWKVCKTSNSALLEDEKEGEILNEILCANADETECLVALLNNLDQELTEKTNEVARLQQQIRNMQEIIDDDTKQKTELNNEVARLREEANNWHQHYRDESSKAQKCKQAFIEQEKEVARLRELLERAIEAIEEEGCPKTANDIREELARLAPSPEETQDGVTMSEWYEGFAKIQSTDPVNEISKLKEMVMDAARRGDELAAHWKERAEKAEALIQQLHHLAEQLPEASKA